MSVVTLDSKAAFDEYLKKTGLLLVHFGASWSESTQPLNDILTELLNEYKDKFQVAYVDAEAVPEAALAANIEAAPTVVFYKNGKSVQRFDGFKPIEIRNGILAQLFEGETGGTSAPVEDLNTRLKALINKKRVTLFMKGLPAQPRCGFSRKIVDLLNQHKIDFWAFDILSDEEVRQGLKKYSDWPTYPQLYLDGELLGGLDVVAEEFESPQFIENLPKISV